MTAPFINTTQVRCPGCGRIGQAPTGKVPGEMRAKCSQCDLIFIYQLAFISPPRNAEKKTTEPELDTEDLESLDPSEALETCDRILGKCDDMPERGEEFAESIREKTESIREWIEANDRVTEGQLTALENMENGLDGWLER